MAATRRRKKSLDRTTPLRRRVMEERQAVYREAIVEAAERVFARNGTDGSRMQEIAAEAGMSLGTLYGVIDGKDALFFAIHKVRMRGFLACIGEARDAHDDTLARHLAVLRQGAEYFLEHPEFLRMCCRDGYGWAYAFAAATPGNELWQESTAIPRDLFARGVDEGIYVDEEPELLVRKMLALKQVELIHWVETGMETAHDVVLDRLVAQFLRAFCKPAL